MCGIISYISKNNKEKAGEKVIEQYQNQFGRGTQGFGIIEIFKNKFNVLRATEPIKAMLDLKFSEAPVIIFHHRTPTSSSNTIKQTHPIKVINDELDYDYYVIHNGILRNEEELKEKHEKLKYIYTTEDLKEMEEDRVYSGYSYLRHSNNVFNDTEAFAIELARFIDGETKEIEINGSYAFIALQINKKTQQPSKIFWGKDDINPLNIKQTESGFLIASTIPDILKEEEPNRLNFLDLNLFFSQKNNKSIDILEFADFKPLKNKEETKEITSIGYNSIYDDNTDYLDSGRENAFTKMAERMTEKISRIFEDFHEERTSAVIEEFCEMISITDIDEEYIDTLMEEFKVMLTENIIDEIKELLKEKAESARNEIRPYFDMKETNDQTLESSIEKEEEKDYKEFKRKHVPYLC